MKAGLVRLAAGAALAMLAAGAATAEEVVLRAVSAFQTGTAFARPFDEFVASVNEAGKGVLRIEVIGGPDAMPPFEIGNALRGGVVDLANTTAVYHANLVPEGLAMTLTDRSMAELRENGGHALLDEIHMQKANIHWLGRLVQNIRYYIYLANAPEGELQLSGLKIRSAPIYQAFFSAIGIAPMQTAPGEVFTALERGTIDGYAWPSLGVFDLGWHEKTAARVEPGFYQVETGVYVSGNAWGRLDDAQKTLLEDQIRAFEDNAGRFADLAAEELKRQAEAGIATYALPEAEAQQFVAQSIEEGWKPIVAANPEQGERLRELFMK